MKLVECVPNVSEGRDRTVLDALAAAISSVDGVELLDVDPGATTHRTVFTFVGGIDAAERAAFALIEKAASLIDMRAHRGEHPRMGATDVCPFVPLGDTTMEECAELARRLGRRVGEELRIPVFLYEAAASSPARRSLADIRKGEFEGLAAKLRDPAWEPDFGPPEPHPRAGATVIGAREFLIAYNVSLNTRDRKLATLIAQNIREAGRPRRGPDGKVLRDSAGAALTEPGPSRMEAVRATGWYIEEYGRAQVSINLTDYKISPPHAVFDAVEKEAAALGLRVTGSEVVGLIPLEAVRMAGRHYLRRQGRTAGLPEEELVAAARLSLGLDDVSPFDPGRKIIEYRVQPRGRLASLPVSGFVDLVSSPAPAPGGGSVAALAGALGAGLAAMVAALTHERKGMEDRRAEMERLGSESQAIKSRLSLAVDDDTRAFEGMMSAGRLPRATEAQRAERERAVQEATRRAIEVPLAVMRDGVRALEIASALASRGMPSARSDAGVAVLAAAAAVEGAWYNVLINLGGLADGGAARTLRAEGDRLLAAARRLRDEAAAHVAATLGER
ncbi:MAG TPA: glutamate formimidoyltransferase [Candidatus Polarisedimenticolia bacterium]|nr:glutamate formimidoyltransferase [Candidatus Polarisedimenticolia bacterium]